LNRVARDRVNYFPAATYHLTGRPLAVGQDPGMSRYAFWLISCMDFPDPFVQDALDAAELTSELDHALPAAETTEEAATVPPVRTSRHRRDRAA
jgi:hypothetical protein